MCGIAGILGRHDKSDLALMAAAIAHRGPDGEGIYQDSAAGLGLVHRRLSIIDTTTAAAQPMSSCAGRYWVSFNGEIYNFRALAQELRGKGYDFNFNSDTAVLAPLYDHYGADFLKRLDGIFALALWDRQKQELLIARDHFGVKPLYYTEVSGRFGFASELKALLGLLGGECAIDHGAILDYLVHLWCPGEGTPLKAVRKLPPGHLIHATRAKIAIERWHAIDVGRALPKAMSATDARSAVLATFNEVVGDQCLSDVPIGAFLSGGVDSSAVVAAMIATGHRPERTYCVGFEAAAPADEGFGEDLVHARQIASRLDVPLVEIIVGEMSPSDLENLVWTLDEPEADPAALYVGKIAEAARADGIKVLLSGAGGDDVFSGYRRHRVAALRSRLGPMASALASPLGSRRFESSGPLGRRLAKLGFLLGGSDEQFLIRAFEFNRRTDAMACLAADAAADSQSRGADWLLAACERSTGAPLLERMLHLEMHGFLPDHNLNYTDKASMAHGVEVRVPFIAPRLVELANRIPWTLKTRGLAEKWIFKQAQTGILPDKILNRKKTGFGGPVRAWVTHGRLGGFAREIINSTSFRQRGLFDHRACDRALADTIAGRRDCAYLIHAVVMIELWMRKFVDDRGRFMQVSNAVPQITSV